MNQETPPTVFGRTQRFREEWLALAIPEPALEPDIPIVDPHAHLFDRGPGFRYFVEEFAKDIHDSGHNIDASIYVECNSMYRAAGPNHLKCVGETEFAVGQAAIAASGKYTKTLVAAGIVGFADMMLGDKLEEVLDAHIEAGNGRVRGIRQGAKWDADPVVRGGVTAGRPEILRDPKLQRGLKKLVARDLLFEASIYHTQLSDVADLARNVPEARIVLIHSGSPVGHGSYAGREKEVHDAWLAGMRDVAHCPNVSLKLGGLLMNSLANFDFGKATRPPRSEELASLWRPYIEPAVELFGPERSMASSNFPVDKAGLTYGTVWNMFKQIFARYSEGEKRAILSGTARNIYKI